MSRKIYITDFDKEKLQKLIKEEKEFRLNQRANLKDLEEELNRAQVLPSEKIPHNVITMNSTVMLKDLDSNEEMTYTLVYPDHADPGANKISVLAPIGTAMLGYQVGDVFNWKIPSGIIRLKVEKILFQPESTGEFGL